MPSNSIQKFKQIILKADEIVLPEKKRQYLSDNRNLETIQDAFAILENEMKWADIGMMLKITAEEFDNTPISLFAARQSRNRCTELDHHRNEIERKTVFFNFKRAESMKSTAISGNKDVVKKYTDRHRFIETAIRLVWNLCDPDNSWPHKDFFPGSGAFYFIAECYLLRSKLALPKGSSVPEKKLEALLRAEEWAEKAVKEFANDKNQEYEDDVTPLMDRMLENLLLEIKLEQGRWDKNYSTSRLKNELYGLMTSLSDHGFDFSNPVHLELNDQLNHLNREFEPTEPDNSNEASGISQNNSMASFLQKNDQKLLHGASVENPLYLARAALRRDAEILQDHLKEAVNRLPEFLQTQKIWDDTVKVIQEAAEKNDFKGKWEDAAVSAWEKCRDSERKIRLVTQVRWYWSRYLDLYRLAFRAAVESGDHEKAAIIADSAKSRPTIKMQDAERTLSGDDMDFYRLYVDSDMLFHTEGFNTSYERLKSYIHSRFQGTEEARPIKDVPEGWTVLHFFIRDNQTATIIPVTKNQVHEPVNFEIHGLWMVFNKWREKQRTFDPGRAEEELKELCETAGAALTPVLKQIQTDKIMFIPNGFFHLLPLHAATFHEKPVLAEKLCLYLPAWSMAPKKLHSASHGENLLISSFSENDSEFKRLAQNELFRNQTKENAGYGETLQLINNACGKDNATGLIAIFAHGKGDYMNPYNAKLMMANGGLTHRKLLQELPDLKGAGIVLSACESDMVSGNNGLVDEHLSIANAFLTKNASEVLGGLFMIPRDLSLILVEQALKYPNRPLYELLREKQLEWTNQQLHKIAPFRVMGFPKDGGDGYA